MNLYEIATQYRQDADNLATLDLDDETLANTLEGLGHDLEEKATNCVAVIKNLEALADAIKVAEAQMEERRNAIENRAERVKEWVLRCMQAAEIQKIETPLFRISRRKNPGRVIVDASSLIPEGFWRHKPAPPPEVDKASILEAYKKGLEIPGAHVEQSERLDIK